MSRIHDQENAFIHQPGRASEHSIPFSDLRADDDTRLLRLWLDNELEGDGESWRYVDIARGGLSITRKFETAQYDDTERNKHLLKQMSRSAFTLYQPDRLADAHGNLAAVPLSRNSSLMLGQALDSPFEALHGSALSQNHVGLYVDDNDVLAIEAYDMDNLPQIEVIAADSDTAVHTGLAVRSYLYPREIPEEGVRIIRAKPVLPPLSSNVQAHSPQFMPSNAVSISEHVEQFVQSF